MADRLSAPPPPAPEPPGSSRPAQRHDTYQAVLDGDTDGVPETFRLLGPRDFSDSGIPIDRYLRREYLELEKERLWRRVWQVACREEEIPEVGDSIVYEICDDSIVVVRERAGAGGIRAFHNSCLHRGRTIRDGPGRLTELRCPFHGFTWNLDGSLAYVPSKWDFPSVDCEGFSLPEVQVGTWGGFVFVNMDPECESLGDFLGVLPSLFSRWPLDDRYTEQRVTKVMRANWKVVQEAFMESFHVAATHPQLLPGFGDANSQYDVFGNVARAISAGAVPSPHLSWTPTEQEILDALLDRRFDDPRAAEVPPDTTARSALASIARARLRRVVGDAADALTDAELADSIYFTVFPNFHPWGAYNRLSYRFKPNGDDHESCEMEVRLLAPFSGDRPPPAQPIRLGPDDPWTSVPELGNLARVFDQDDHNIVRVQKGLRASRRRVVTLARYQETKIRHFHLLYEQWLGIDRE